MNFGPSFASDKQLKHAESLAVLVCSQLPELTLFELFLAFSHLAIGGGWDEKLKDLQEKYK